MVAIAAGTTAPSPGNRWSGRPAHGAVAVDALCLDRTEVTVRAYARCVADGACPEAARTISYGAGEQAGSAACNAGREGAADHPINCVTFAQAEAFCAWRGARLPTALEWEWAARGPDARPMPWGDAPLDATRANVLGTETPDALVPVPRRAPLDDGWAGTAPVGAFPAGATPEGVQDLGGNVAEWCAPLDPADPRRPVLGAAWGDDDPAAKMIGGAIAPTDHDEFTGFRCAADSVARAIARSRAQRKSGKVTEMATTNEKST